MSGAKKAAIPAVTAKKGGADPTNQPAKRDTNRRLLGADGKLIDEIEGDKEADTLYQSDENSNINGKKASKSSNGNGGSKVSSKRLKTSEDSDNEALDEFVDEIPSELMKAPVSRLRNRKNSNSNSSSNSNSNSNNDNGNDNNDDGNGDDDDDEYLGTTKKSDKKGKARGKRVSSNTIVNDDDENHEDEKENMDGGDEADEDEVGVSPDESGSLDLPGHILKVHCVQFMCHKKFTMEFGKNINFVTGPNGSGKSAVVSAIMICLGARAATTGRGSTLGSYVREGSAGPAIVEVTLKNAGDDAYLPHMYGKKITVRRKIMKAGSVSAYQLLNEKMEVVSEKKADLEQILRAFNIDIQNPCCVLTQEDSKKFIQGGESDKYDFFLRATGLKRAAEEHAETRELLDLTKANQAVILESLEIKETVWNKTKEDLDKFLASEHLEAQKRQLQAKKYWVEVEAKDALVSKEIATKAKCEKDIKSYEDKYTEAVKHLEDADKGDFEIVNEVERIAQEIEEVKAKENLTNKEYNELNKVLSQKKNAFQEINKLILENEKALASNGLELADLLSRQKRDDSSKERALEDTKKQIRDQLADLLEKEESAEAQKSAMNEEFVDLQRQLADARSQADGIKQDIDRCSYDLKGVSSLGKGLDSRVNALSREAVTCYNLVKLEIQKGKLFKGEVIGPLLLYIAKQKNVPEEMSQAIEKSISVNFQNYIVTCKEDERALRNLTKTVNCFFSIIVQSPYQGGGRSGSSSAAGGRGGGEEGVSGLKYNANTEKIPNVTRLIDVLSIEHPLVYNTLLDMAEMDRVAFVKDEKHMKSTIIQGDGRNKNFKHSIKTAYSYNGTQYKYSVGNQSAYPNYDNRFFPKLVSDMADIIKAKEREIADKTAEYSAAAKDASELDKALRGLKQRREGLNSSLASGGGGGGGGRNKESNRTQLHNQMKNIDTQLQELRAVSNIDTSELESDILSIKNSIADFKIQLEPLQEALKIAEECLDICKDARKEVANHKQKLLRVLDSKSDIISRNNNERDKFAEKVELASRALKLIKQKLESQAKNLQAIETDRDERLAFAKTQTADLIEQWDGEALQLASADTTASLDNQIRRLNDKIIKHRQENALLFTGLSLEMLTDRCNNAKRDYRDCKKQNDANEKSVTELELDIKDRYRKWRKQLKSAETTVRQKFDHYLQMKGQAGNLKFNHDDQTLHLQVLVDNTKDKSSNICTDVKQLSGGERSYATLCLLLAFDHVIDFPFRLMDEYDVFMDEFTRKITLMSIVEHALTPSQSNKQLFIITPLNLKALADLKVSQRSKIKTNLCQRPEDATGRGKQQQTLNLN